MIEKITEDIFRISVPLSGNPLKELNSYFIKGTDSDLLIDSGFRMPGCRETLAAGLNELGSVPERRDILLTHLHTDHSGLANDFVGPGRRIYISKIDMEYLYKVVSGETGNALNARFKSEGFPEDQITSIVATDPARVNSLECVTDQFYSLEDGEKIQVGDYSLQTVLVPGHTPGCCMFWAEQQKIMFTGDHVLFNITPNIAAWMWVEDPLGNYLNSLDKSLRYPVELALPGHRKPGNYHTRIGKLMRHHELRINEALNVIAKTPGLSAYEIASRMTWKIRADSWETFPQIQKWFAVGECLSHLDYLRKRGRIGRMVKEDVYRYFPIIIFGK